MKGQDASGHTPRSGTWKDQPEPEVATLQVQRDLFKNYSYLVVDPRTRKAVLVDPAWEMDKIEQEMAHREASLGAVLVTHAHFDHTDLALAFAERYRCPVWASADAIAQLSLPAKHLHAVDGLRTQIGEMLIEAIPTPGHTSGCVCYLIGDNLFSGDTLFAEGCGMCSSVIAARTMFQSLEMLKGVLRPTTRIYPGHSYGIPAGQPFSTVLRDNIYLQFQSSEAFTAFRLRRGQNFARMFQFK